MHLVIADEGRGPFAQDANTIKGRSTLSDLQGTGRSANVCFYVLTNALSLTDRGLRSNVFLTAAFRPANGEDATLLQRTLGLSDEETAYLARAPRGEVVAKLGGLPAFLATFDPLPDHYDTAAYERARDRTHTILSTKRTAAAREGDGSTGWQPSAGAPTATVSHDTSAPDSGTDVPNEPRALPNDVEQTTGTNAAPPPLRPAKAQRRVPLPKHAAALLADAANHPLTLSTPSYKRCGLRLSEGDRAKALLLNLELLESHRLRTGSGPGTTGTALRLTPSGWTWLGRTATKGTRGGDGVQHEFFVQQLHALIPRSSIETLGADLVLAYNTAEHEQFHNALQLLAGRSIALNDGDLLALEVECSRPDITAKKNIARNTGFALTIIATFGKKTLQLPSNDHVVIVDVLRLLDALRRTEER